MFSSAGSREKQKNVILQGKSAANKHQKPSRPAKTMYASRSASFAVCAYPSVPLLPEAGCFRRAAGQRHTPEALRLPGFSRFPPHVPNRLASLLCCREGHLLSPETSVRKMHAEGIRAIRKPPVPCRTGSSCPDGRRTLPQAGCRTGSAFGQAAALRTAEHSENTRKTDCPCRLTGSAGYAMIS